MDTSVVNVKVSCIRPKYNNLKEWMEDPNNVYIGRRGIVFIDGVRFPAKDSIWANPYKIGKDGDRAQVLAKYREYIVLQITEPSMRDALSELKGKILGCWCKPDECHGDILVNLLAE